MKPLVECVPNFSEGRDRAKIEAILAVIRKVPDVFVLAHESDWDHNRSVITLAGDPDRVAEAAVRAVGRAAELVDLTRQTGAHPRIGATDVVPFIPVHGVTIEDCVQLAKKAAAEIWERYQIPVYLYEAAAQRPERTHLEKIRKGQFEGLREEVLRNPDRAPDVGEPRLHPTAGATVVGARKFLIAYNINLDTPDVEIAKKIAKAVRFSNGGLPFVKAMGVDLRARNLAQVSMNLTDFEQTPVHTVFEAVKREAEKYGAGVVASEIVGLIPRRAIEATAEAYLKVENFSPAQVFENRLEEALLAAQPASNSFQALVRPFLDQLARPAPTPGGGSVAALAGALGASLGQMVAGLSSRKKTARGKPQDLAVALAAFGRASERLGAAIDHDASSYESVLVAHRLPRETEEDEKRREVAIQRALEGAVEAPLEIAREAADVFDRLGQLESMSAPSMISDVRVGRMMAAAAVRGAVENVRTNLESITDAAFVAKARAEADSLALRMAADSVAAGKI